MPKQTAKKQRYCVRKALTNATNPLDQGELVSIHDTYTSASRKVNKMQQQGIDVYAAVYDEE